jgi:ribosomal subunit interface protein
LEYDMQLILQGTNIELTERLRALIDEKIGSLSHLLEALDPESVEARIEVGVPQEHVVSRGIYRAEVNLKLPGALLRAVAEDRTMRGALTQVSDELRQQVEEYRERRFLAGHIGGKGTPPESEERYKGA